MALKISGKDTKRLAVLADELRALRNGAEDAVRAHGEAIAAANAALEAAVDPYSEKANEAFGVVEDIHREAEEIFDCKSEKWQSSEAGEAASEWIQKMSAVLTSLGSPMTLPVPTELNLEEVFPEDLSDVLEGLPSEPEPV